MIKKAEKKVVEKKMPPAAKKPKKSLNFANGYAIMPEEAAWRTRERVSEGRAEINLGRVRDFPKYKFLSLDNAEEIPRAHYISYPQMSFPPHFPLDERERERV